MRFGYMRTKRLEKATGGVANRRYVYRLFIIRPCAGTGLQSGLKIRTEISRLWVRIPPRLPICLNSSTVERLFYMQEVVIS